MLEDNNILRSKLGGVDNWQPSIGGMVYNLKNHKLYYIGDINQERAFLLSCNDVLFNYGGYAEIDGSLTSDIIPYFEHLISKSSGDDYEDEYGEDDIYIEQPI